MPVQLLALGKRRLPRGLELNRERRGRSKKRRIRWCIRAWERDRVYAVGVVCWRSLVAYRQAYVWLHVRGIRGQRRLKMKRSLLWMSKYPLSRLRSVLVDHDLLGAMLMKSWRELLDWPRVQVGVVRWIIYRLIKVLIVGRWPYRDRASLKGEVCGSIPNIVVVESRRLEDDALIIALTMALAFDTILTDRPLLIALDAPLATGQATSFGSFPGESCLQCRLSS